MICWRFKISIHSDFCFANSAKLLVKGNADAFPFFQLLRFLNFHFLQINSTSDILDSGLGHRRPLHRAGLPLPRPCDLAPAHLSDVRLLVFLLPVGGAGGI
jgi:hypothetical protein